MRKTAVIEDPYRYELTRRWGEGPDCVFIMLNPSTADADTDDPTIRRCIGFAKREGCGGLIVVNLFAFRATSPDDMKAAPDPIGPKNDAFITRALEKATGPIISAWGNHGNFRGRSQYVASRLLGSLGQCFGVTQLGQPRHPLYVKSDQPLAPFRAKHPTEGRRG